MFVDFLINELCGCKAITEEYNKIKHTGDNAVGDLVSVDISIRQFCLINNNARVRGVGSKQKIGGLLPKILDKILQV